MKNKALNPLIMVINLIAIALCVFGSIYSVIRVDAGDVYSRIAAILNIVALLSSAVYVLYGCKKNAAQFFRGFMICYSLSLLSTIVGATMQGPDIPATVIVYLVVFALIVVLAAGTDLGKKVSYVICGIIFAVNLGYFIWLFFTSPGIFRGGDMLATANLIGAGSQLALSSLLGVMTVAKYIDKANRKKSE